MNVSNRKCVRTLARRSLKANCGRNLIAIMAIILTTVLFASLFTIAGTIINSYQQQTFRQVGGDMHGTFKDISFETMEDLAADPLIVKSAARLMLGMPQDPPFNKAHVEVSYMDANCAKGFFCWPEQGTLPQEGTKQIACDTRILKLLGVEPKIGAEITMPYTLGFGTTRQIKKEDTFTLSGWWEYDPAGMASQAIVARSYAEEVLSDYERLEKHDSTGLWTLNVYFKNTAHIESDLKTILENHDYQSDDPKAENYIGLGVNWAYIGAQVSGNADPMTIIAFATLLILIIFTGYLIIYNIFQISVSNDIKFYGLLKTIGTTPRQIRRMIRHQALALCLLGIPIGLIIGYIAGNILTPIIMGTLSYHVTHATIHPLIFIGAAAFSLITVLISCHKPARIAGKVSPVEAVRYTENSGSKKGIKKGKKGGKVFPMALSNLGRNKKKTVLVVLSLSLAIVLLQLTYIFAAGFDMDKYLRNFVVTDFILGDAAYFQVGGELFNVEQALPEEAITQVESLDGITGSGRVYGSVNAEKAFVTEDWYRSSYGSYVDDETLDIWLKNADYNAEGLVANSIDLYGMEDYALDQIRVVDGDLAPLYDPNQKAIAAVYLTDDYDNVTEDSNWANVGDQVTIRYEDEREYYDTRNGEVGDPETIEPDYLDSRVTAYHDVTYTVTARVVVPHSMSFRYYGSDQFVLNADVFLADSGTSAIMSYLFDTTDESTSSIEEFLKDYTENIDISLDYESKQSYTDEFESFRGMFMVLGGSLSFIIGLVGILNFLNAVLTSIITRRREFAVLQSIGMTGKQLKTMLIWEGVLYAAFALLLALILNIVSGPLLGNAMNNIFWFFTYQSSLLPIVCVAPLFLILGIALPLITYGRVARQTVVERLRQVE